MEVVFDVRIDYTEADIRNRGLSTNDQIKAFKLLEKSEGEVWLSRSKELSFLPVKGMIIDLALVDDVSHSDFRNHARFIVEEVLFSEAYNRVYVWLLKDPTWDVVLPSDFAMPKWEIVDYPRASLDWAKKK